MTEYKNSVRTINSTPPKPTVFIKFAGQYDLAAYSAKTGENMFPLRELLRINANDSSFVENKFYDLLFLEYFLQN